MRRLTLLALAAPLLLAAPLWAQEPTPATPPPMAGHAHAMGPATGAGGGCGGGGENCPCKAMMAKMDSANVQIAELTEKMNKASGSKKTEAMSALLNALELTGKKIADGKPDAVIRASEVEKAYLGQ